MPELAEVEFSRLQWNAGLGKKTLSVALHPRTRLFRDVAPAQLRSAITNRPLRSSRAHGKRLLFDFGDNLALEVHLGMTGRLSVAPPGHRPEKHDHLVLFQERRALVFNDYRQFGRLLLHRGPDPWVDLPPQPLDRAFTKKRLAGILSRHARTAIKPLLLEQKFFPGVGNWMADEILWRARLHPAMPAADTDPAVLWSELRAVCRGALRHVAGKTASARHPSAKLNHHTEAPAWGSPPATWLFQHRWTGGGRCPRRGCQTPLVRATIRQRTTCYCPACQPA